MPWSVNIWGRLNIPRHRFIMWLTALQKLQTRAKLWKLKIISEQSCCICGCDIEDIQHLFFRCKYSRGCMDRIKTWLMVSWSYDQFMQILEWVGKRKRWSGFRKQVFSAVLAAGVYHVWKARNEALWAQKLWSIEYTVQNVRRDIIQRVKLVMPKKMKTCDRVWFDELCKRGI